jgi:beta-glucosidase
MQGGGTPGTIAGMPERRRAGGPAPGAAGGDPPPIGMLEAVKSGQVKEATINLAVGRILVQMDRFGLLDGKQKHTITEEDHAFNAPILRETAEDSATLLKNQDHVLPLAAADLDSTVFIGPTVARWCLSGRPATGRLPDFQVGPVPALEKIAGRTVAYQAANDLDGTPIPSSALSNLTRTDTATKATQADAAINFTLANKQALPSGASFTWAGTLTVPSDGTYTFAFQTRGTTGTVDLDANRIITGSGGGRGGGGMGAAAGAAAAPPPQLPPGRRAAGNTRSPAASSRPSIS